jgi:hypothetical protein
MWLAVLCIGGFLQNARAQSARTPTVVIQSVLAVEQADAIDGRYLIIFTTREALPAPKSSRPDPIFQLGDQPLTVRRPYRAQQTLHFGYFDQLPDGPRALQALYPLGADDLHPIILSQIQVNAPELLARSKPARGGFEPSYIVRSAEPANLWQAWTGADTVCVATFIRNDIDQNDKAVQQRYFQVVERLRGAATPTDSVLLHRTSPNQEFELGARYVLFLKSNRGAVDPDHYTAVRIWWPQNDFVLSFLSARASIAAADVPALRDFLVQELTTNPAADVRFSAATELLALKDVPQTAAQIQTIQSRAALEPSASVKSVMDRLIRATPNR